MYLGVEQWFAGLCFPGAPKELCWLQGQGRALSIPGPAMCGALRSLAQAASGGTTPWSITLFPSQCSCVCWGQQQARAVLHPMHILCLSRSAPLRGWRWPRALSVLLCPSCCSNGTTRDVSLGIGCGQSCLFPPLPLPVIKDKVLIVPALCSVLDTS